MCVCAKTDKIPLRYIVAESTYKRFEPGKEYTQARQNYPWKAQDLHGEAVPGSNGLGWHLLKTFC